MNDSAPAGPQGFSILPNWMIQDLRVDGQMLATYVALASYADRTGLAYPGLPALAKRARLGTTSTREALRRLEALGVVAVTARGRQDGGQSTNLYRIAVHERGLNYEPPHPPPPGVGGPHREALGAPPSGVDEQDPDNNTHSSPLQAPQGAEPIDGLDTPPAPEPEHFGLFWAAYPRKVGRPQALRAWTKAIKGGTHWSLIVGAAQAYAEDPNREAAFTAHPSTWLNREGWNDDPIPERVQAPPVLTVMPNAPQGTMSERVTDCHSIGRQHRLLGDGTCMLCEVRSTG